MEQNLGDAVASLSVANFYLIQQTSSKRTIKSRQWMKISLLCSCMFRRIDTTDLPPYEHFSRNSTPSKDCSQCPPTPTTTRFPQIPTQEALAAVPVTPPTILAMLPNPSPLSSRKVGDHAPTSKRLMGLSQVQMILQPDVLFSRARVGGIDV